MNTSDKPPYEVGRGRPPVHSQFKAGQSGNPSGRPKRRRSFKCDLIAALDALTTGANGETTKQQKFADNLIDDALARDPLAIKILVQVARELDDGDDGNHHDQLSPQEQKLVEDFNRRDQPTDSTTTSPEDSSHD